MIKGEQTYISNSAARQREEFAIKNEKLRARIAELEAALKPFADVADVIPAELRDGYTWIDAFPAGAFRAARAALGEKDD